MCRAAVRASLRTPGSRRARGRRRRHDRHLGEHAELVQHLRERPLALQGDEFGHFTFDDGGDERLSDAVTHDFRGGLQDLRDVGAAGIFVELGEPRGHEVLEHLPRELSDDLTSLLAGKARLQRFAEHARRAFAELARCRLHAFLHLRADAAHRAPPLLRDSLGVLLNGAREASRQARSEPGNSGTAAPGRRGSGDRQTLGEADEDVRPDRREQLPHQARIDAVLCPLRAWKAAFVYDPPDAGACDIRHQCAERFVRALDVERVAMESGRRVPRQDPSEVLRAERLHDDVARGVEVHEVPEPLREHVVHGHTHELVSKRALRAAEGVHDARCRRRLRHDYCEESTKFRSPRAKRAADPSSRARGREAGPIFSGRTLGSRAVLVLGALLLAPTALANGRFPRAQRFIESPTDPNLLALYGTYGLVVSSDAGRSWNHVCEAATGTYAGDDPLLEILPDGKIVARTESSLIRSTGSWCNWASIRGDSVNAVQDITRTESNPSSILALLGSYTQAQGFSAAFAQSKDGGTTWSPETKLPVIVRGLSIDVAPSSPERVVVSGLDGSGEGQLLVSDDGGSTWQARPIQTSDAGHRTWRRSPRATRTGSSSGRTATTTSTGSRRRTTRSSSRSTEARAGRP
jgi:hypothetical protein